jgi:hypothetical protein
MKRIISKTVLALYPGGQLLEDQFFENVKQLLHIKSPYTQTYDSGDTKKNVIPTTGFGSRWRENNPGAGIGTGEEEEESPSRGVGSGYNDLERADIDEQGPGFSPKLPELYPYDNDNELFIDLKMKNEGDNLANRKTIRENMMKTLHRPGLAYHKRIPVDQN